MKSLNSKLNNKGFTLVELMIAMFIGLFLLTGIATTYLSGKKSSVERNEHSALEDNGRLVLDYLSKSIEHVGYSPGRPQLNKFITSMAQITEDTCSDGTANVVKKSDLKAIGYYKTSFSYYGDSNLFTDCAGGELPSECRLKSPLETSPLPEAAKIYNSFYLDSSDNNSLKCAGSRSNAPVVIAEGVEHLVFLYGVDLVDDDEVKVDRYVPWNLLGDKWNNVVSVQIGVVIRSSKPVKNKNEKKGFTIFNHGYTSPNDKYLRDAFTTTVFLRNTK